MRGLFITVEGIEGSGKSTQIRLLAEFLAASGRPFTLTREPGGTPIGDQIRQVLLDPANRTLTPVAELLLYAASRAQHCAEVIAPAREAGRIVVCDRFSDATTAYQGFGRGLDRDLIRMLDQVATGGLRPDRTILLDIDPAAGLGRAHSRNRSEGLEREARFENEDLAFHRRVREGYLALAHEEPGRIIRIDASLPAEQVREQIRTIMQAMLEQVKA